MDILDLSSEQLFELNKRLELKRDPNNPYGVIAPEVVEEVKQAYFNELTAPVQETAVAVSTKPSTKEGN